VLVYVDTACAAQCPQQMLQIHCKK